MKKKDINSIIMLYESNKLDNVVYAVYGIGSSGISHCKITAMSIDDVDHALYQIEHELDPDYNPEFDGPFTFNLISIEEEPIIIDGVEEMAVTRLEDIPGGAINYLKKHRGLHLSVTGDDVIQFLYGIDSVYREFKEAPIPIHPQEEINEIMLRLIDDGVVEYLKYDEGNRARVEQSIEFAPVETLQPEWFILRPEEEFTNMHWNQNEFKDFDDDDYDDDDY